MFEKLALLEQRYDEIEALLADPAVYSDLARFTELSKERKEMSEVVETYREYKRAEREANEALEILSGEDHDLKELARRRWRLQRTKCRSSMTA